MKRGFMPVEKLIIFIIVIAVILILAVGVFKIQDLKELFTQLLESFK